jgi:DNA polymerase-3 subunit epsilon
MDPGVVTQPSFLDRYRECFATTWTGETPIDAVRFVVVDTETTGLNPRTDRIVTIGAVAVRDREFVLDDSFSALLEVERYTEAGTGHGITRDQSRGGLAEPDALAAFLDYLRDGVIVGHHIGHDIATMDAACERHWNTALANRSLDTMDLALHLERDGAFAGRPPIRRFTLDALCGMFDIVPHDRHTAAGDAFITAQVFLRLLRLASKHGRATLGPLSEVFPIDA